MQPKGRVITFYSYKGGTGRTMLLANVAWILASNGKRVLTIDWDLEAPGLHHYFYPFLVDRELGASDGLMEMVVDYAAEVVTPRGAESADAHDRWLEERADITRYAVSLDWPFPGEGRLDFVPAGRQGPSYAVCVNTFDWRMFYERLSGGNFFEIVRQRLKERYDYILIDGRTGVSDTAGICTVQMPDRLVVCFTLSEQNIRGAAAISASVRSQWKRLSKGPDDNRRILPIITRVEQSEKIRLDAARNRARALFGSILEPTDIGDWDTYWGKAEAPYVPYYAYEETLAVFADQPRVENSILSSCENLTAVLTDRSVSALVPPGFGQPASCA